MEKVAFLKKLTSMFSEKGFTCKSKHFYKEASEDVVIVFGLYRSSYGGYYYIEYGYYFKTINRHLPFPKFNQLNLNCGRLMTSVGKAFHYEKMDENDINEINKMLCFIVPNMINLVNMGREKLIQYYLSGQSNQSWYILGDETVQYFGLPKEKFLYHFVEE